MPPPPPPPPPLMVSPLCTGVTPVESSCPVHRRCFVFLFENRRAREPSERLDEGGARERKSGQQFPIVSSYFHSDTHARRSLIKEKIEDL